MKRLLAGLLLVTAIPALADCTNAYEVRAQKRAKVNKVLKQAGVIAVLGGGTVAASLALLATGGAAIVATPIIFSSGSALTGFVTADVEETRSNTFFKVLASIEGAKHSVLPHILLERLDRKMALYSLSDEEQAQTRRKVIDIIVEANASKELCTKANGKIKTMNFRKFVRFIDNKLSI
tara:strand:- start:2830 stop:3366 length:537 start_codon:yes stop_codon:yes gene_type:complete